MGNNQFAAVAIRSANDCDTLNRWFENGWIPQLNREGEINYFSLYDTNLDDYYIVNLEKPFFNHIVYKAFPIRVYNNSKVSEDIENYNSQMERIDAIKWYRIYTSGNDSIMVVSYRTLSGASC